MFTLINKKGENMKKRKLKKWVVPALSSMLIIAVIFGVYQVSLRVGENNKEGKDKYVINALIDNSQPVVDTEDTIMTLPYTSENVVASKNYYSKDDVETEQETSLIFYENIYIQNTGVLYSSDEQFDIVSVLDGTIKNIKEDELLGFVIEIENNERITTVYQSVDNITVKIGDTVEKGMIIATSGNNALSNEKDNCLHFEVYVDGKLTDPENLYNKDINQLK